MMDMWKLWVLGILGFLTALTPFLGLTPDLEDIATVIFGIAIVIFAFVAGAVKRSA